MYNASGLRPAPLYIHAEVHLQASAQTAQAGSMFDADRGLRSRAG